MLQDDKRPRMMATAILSVASAAIVVWQNARLTVLWDLSYVLENASRIAAGDVPYRDFPFPYAPGTFAVQAAIIRMFGRAAWHHTAWAAIACAAATALTFAIVHRITRNALLSILIALPLSILGIYCIFPHPFYDPDCCLAIAAIALALLCVRTPRGLAMVAACVPLTLLIKQNIGLGFICGFVIWIVASRDLRTIAAGAAGLAVGGAIVLIVVASVFGVTDYVTWTVRFAASRRLPSIAEQLAPFRDQVIWFSALSVIAGFAVARWNRAVASLLIAAPWIYVIARFFVTDDPVEPEIQFLRVWPVVMIASLATLVMARDRDWRVRAMPLLIVATIYGVFLSQGTWGSTYGIWPLLIVLIAVMMPLTPFRRAQAALLTATILLGGIPYVLRNERLTYVKVDGVVRTSSLPQLRGLHMAGEWLPGFEELVRWTDVNIPRDDGIVCLPGEDLFYFTTGRRPHFPVLMFDRTINPFSAEEIARLARERNVRWVIVKKGLQLNGTPFDVASVLRLMRLRRLATLRNYDVYSVL